jgi:histidinol dehydrogenase
VYIPGGRATYPSTVLMTAVPARVAGVKEIVLVTPPGADGRVNPVVLAAARVAGVTEAWRLGGAQAVAALAYGTATIRRVDKIVGPGNIYVALAKTRVFGEVGIDMMAGPSEVVVVADGGANPDWIAADLLAQAEHDPMARAVLITDAATLPPRVEAALDRRLAALDRRQIAAAALRDHGALIVTESLERAVEIANRLAPEHLELMVAVPAVLLPRVRHAGAVFLGAHTPEVVGDYVAGPNHVLPTAGTARFASPLGTEDFVKRSSVLEYSPSGLAAALPHLTTLSRIEGLTAHGRAAEARNGGSSHMSQARQARVERKTKETEITLTLGLDGTGASKITTPIPFFSHMLEAFSKHGLVDLAVEAQGDIEVDQHHTVEDVGIVLGQAIRQALGDKKGIVRFGTASIPMDETLVSAAVDVSGRPYLVFSVPVARGRVSNFDCDLLQEFFRAFAFNAEITLHVTMHYGHNLHHITEAVFKAVGRALAQATRHDPRIAGILPSTKGTL